MTTIKTSVIDTSKIKTRWEEPYVSSAINKEMAALPRGVYRGFEVTQQSTPAKGVLLKIKTGEDSLLVHRSFTSGHSTVVRYDSDLTLNFDFDASGGALTYYIWCDVNYTVSSATSGSLLVGESGDRSADSITICKIVIPMGATIIINSYITQDWEDNDTLTTPIPANNSDWALLNQTLFNQIPSANEKDGLSNASPAASSSNPYVTEDATVDKVFAKPTLVTVGSLAGTETKFQLTGSYYIGTGAIGTAQKWFGLYSFTGGNQNPDEYSGASTSKIYITAIYKNDDSAQVTPSSDADANGFYTNPYIYLSGAIGVTSIGVRCGVASTFGNQSVNGFISETGSGRTGASVDVSYLAYANNARKPVTYTVSTDTTQKVDFAGTNAIIDALDALEASLTVDSAVIYVKNGTYVWTGSGGNRTYTKPVKIIGETVGWVHGSIDATCKLSMQHSSGYGITFSAPVQIENMEIGATTSASLIQFDSQYFLRFCKFVYGKVFFHGSGSDTTPDGGVVESCLFDSAAANTMANLSAISNGSAWINCVFKSYGAYAVTISGTNKKVKFENCVFDGTRDNSVNGPGIYFGANSSLLSSSFSNCVFKCKQAYSAIKIDSLAVFENVYFYNSVIHVNAAFGSNSTQGSIDYINYHDSFIGVVSAVFDGVFIYVNHSSDLTSPLINVTSASTLAKSVNITFRNVEIFGGGNTITGAGPGAPSVKNNGIVRLLVTDSSACQTKLLLDGMNVVGLLPSTSTDPDYCGVLVNVAAMSVKSFVEINRLTTTHFTSQGTISYSHWNSIAHTYDNSLGVIRIRNCDFDLSSATTGTTSTRHRAISFSNYNTAFLEVIGNKFNNCRHNDLFHGSSSNAGTLVFCNNISAINTGSGLAGTLLARVYSTSYHNVISGNSFMEVADVGLEYYCYIDVSGSIQAHAFNANTIRMYNSGSEYILYASDTTSRCSAIGNAGPGAISYKSGLVNTGDATMNSVSSVTARP